MNDKTELQELDKSLQRKSPDIVYHEKVKRVQKVKSTTVLKTDSDEKPTTLKAKSLRKQKGVSASQNALIKYSARVDKIQSPKKVKHGKNTLNFTRWIIEHKKRSPDIIHNHLTILDLKANQLVKTSKK